MYILEYLYHTYSVIPQENSCTKRIKHGVKKPLLVQI